MSTDDVDLGESAPEPESDLELGEQTRETLLNAILLFPGRLQRLWKRLRGLARR